MVSEIQGVKVYYDIIFQSDFFVKIQKNHFENDVIVDIDVIGHLLS